MRFSAIQQGAASALLLCLLSACGGGGEYSTQSKASPASATPAGTAPAAPAPVATTTTSPVVAADPTPVVTTPATDTAPVVASPSTGAVPASNTLVLAADGSSSVAAGNYTLDTSAPDAAYSADAGGLVIISPENAAFDMRVTYVPADPGKYVISFIDNTGAVELNFMCRSGSWTEGELAIAVTDSNTLADAAVCSKGITLDEAAHRITFLELPLTALGEDTARKVTVSANFTWTAPGSTTAALP